jgi:hypothetical protein
MTVGDGAVGIGTTSPGSYKLNVAGTGLFTGFFEMANGGAVYQAQKFYLDGGGDTFLESPSSNLMTFTVGATERMRIRPNGTVGIGTDNAVNSNVSLRVVNSINSEWIAEFKNTNTAGNTYGLVVNTLAGAGTYNLGCYTHTGNGFFVQNDGKVGIGTGTPKTTLEVNGAASALNAHFGQGTNNSSGVFGGISLGYSETGNAGYRKVGIVAKAIGDGAARQELHFLVDTVADSNSAGTADSKLMISGTTGYVGLSQGVPAERLHVNGRIQTAEGIISPTFYVARNYGSTSGNFAGYDDMAEGDIINILDHSIGSLQSFAHGVLDPKIQDGTMDWNYFRLLFRYTDSVATYTNNTVGFKVARYIYTTGWAENGAEFSGTGMDGARGPRWAVSPWVTTGGTDVPGIGLKYFNNNAHTRGVRVHAIYIQYKS